VVFYSLGRKTLRPVLRWTSAVLPVRYPDVVWLLWHTEHRTGASVRWRPGRRMDARLEVLLSRWIDQRPCAYWWTGTAGAVIPGGCSRLENM